jgi:hypothetical protein
MSSNKEILSNKINPTDDTNESMILEWLQEDSAQENFLGVRLRTEIKIQLISLPLGVKELLFLYTRMRV